MMSDYMAYLEADVPQNAPLLSAIRRGSAEILAAGSGGVLLYERLGRVHILSAAGEEEAARLLEGLDRCRVMMLCQSRLAPIPAAKYGLRAGTPCRQVIYTGRPLPLDDVLAFRRPGDREMDRIAETYALADREELEDLRRRGDLYCGFADGAFVGFVGRHQEGSVGLLEVFPEYRRLGYGQRLEAFIVNQVLSRGELPYGQVFIDNENSLNLQRKLGWTFAGEYVCWMVRER